METLLYFRSLKKSKTNDFIIYSDCGDMFSYGLKPYLENTLMKMIYHYCY